MHFFCVERERTVLMGRKPATKQETLEPQKGRLMMKIILRYIQIDLPQLRLQADSSLAGSDPHNCKCQNMQFTFYAIYTAATSKTDFEGHRESTIRKEH